MDTVRVPPVIKFNVGGRVFLTSLSTLRARGPNMLSTMVHNHYDGASGDGQLRCVEVDGALFIDRSGAAFEYVLHYLRTGTLTWAGGCSSEMLRDELAFYAVPVDETDSALVSESHARALFEVSEQHNKTMAEAGRFLAAVWPVMNPHLLARAQQGLSFATFVIRKSALAEGGVAYAILALHFEFKSAVDFNDSADPWSGGNGWSVLTDLCERKPYLLRSSLIMRETLEWSVSWSYGGIQAKRDAGDVYALLSHAIKRRDNCGGSALIDARNCKCYLSARDPQRKK